MDKEERNKYMRLWRSRKETSKNRIADQAHTAWCRDAKRVLKANQGGFVEINPDNIKQMKELYKTTYELNEMVGSSYYSVDHIVEIADGGDHTFDNLQIIPFHMNLKKSAIAKKKRHTRPLNNRYETR